jgi:hypothetical protein
MECGYVLRRLKTRLDLTSARGDQFGGISGDGRERAASCADSWFLGGIDGSDDGNKRKGLGDILADVWAVCPAGIWVSGKTRNCQTEIAKVRNTIRASFSRHDSAKIRLVLVGHFSDTLSYRPPTPGPSLQCIGHGGVLIYGGARAV